MSGRVALTERFVRGATTEGRLSLSFRRGDRLQLLRWVTRPQDRQPKIRFARTGPEPTSHAMRDLPQRVMDRRSHHRQRGRFTARSGLRLVVPSSPACRSPVSHKVLHMASVTIPDELMERAEQFGIQTWLLMRGKAPS